MGHIRPNLSSFASLVVLVKKKDETLCTCIDSRALNKKIIKKGIQFPELMSCYMNYMVLYIF